MGYVTPLRILLVLCRPKIFFNFFCGSSVLSMILIILVTSFETMSFLYLVSELLSISFLVYPLELSSYSSMRFSGSLFHLTVCTLDNSLLLTGGWWWAGLEVSIGTFRLSVCRYNFLFSLSTWTSIKNCSLFSSN